MVSSHDQSPEDDRPPDPFREDGEALTLFHLALDGDEEAWRKLFTVHEGHMRQVLRNRIPLRLRSGIDTEDLMQAAFFKLSQVGPGLQIPDARSLRAWLARVLMNQLRDRLREQDAAARRGLGGPRPSTQDFEQHPAEGPTLEQLAQEAELSARMYERILALEGVDREIVLARFVDRLIWTEVAERTGLAVTTVTNRYRELIDRMVRGFF